MNDMTIPEFCNRHGACREGTEWALANCSTMLEVWNTARPGWLLWVATRRGVLTDRELRLFAVWCARQVQHLMADERSVAALDVAERYATGEATAMELDAADDAAAAARDEASATMFDPFRSYLVAIDAASAAAAATWAAVDARAAAWRASLCAANVASKAVADDAATAAAWAAQAEHLRATCIPRFTRVEEQVEVTP